MRLLVNIGRLKRYRGKLHDSIETLDGEPRNFPVYSIGIRTSAVDAAQTPTWAAGLAKANEADRAQSLRVVVDVRGEA